MKNDEWKGGKKLGARGALGYFLNRGMPAMATRGSNPLFKVVRPLADQCRSAILIIKKGRSTLRPYSSKLAARSYFSNIILPEATFSPAVSR
jgi:hypothetical protein